MVLTHRIGDLEISGQYLTDLIQLTHRIGDLEMHVSY